MSEDAMVDLGAAETSNATATAAAATTTTGGADATAAAAAAAGTAPRIVDVDGQAMEIPEQYWDAKAGAPNIGALVKANQDMRTKLASRAAPEAYDLALPEEFKGVLNLDTKDALVVEGLGILKEGNVDQATASKLLAWMGKREAVLAQADAEAEAAATQAKGKLVESMGGEAQVADLNKWLTAIAGGQPVRTTVEGAVAMAKWRASLGEKGVPSGRDVPAAGAPLTQEQLRGIMAEPDYWSNPTKQKTVAEGYERLFGGAAGGGLKPGVL